MVRSGSFKNPKSLMSCGSSRSIKMATRSPALGLNTVFNKRERLNGGNFSGTVSFVWAIIAGNFVLTAVLVKESIRYTSPSRLQTHRRQSQVFRDLIAVGAWSYFTVQACLPFLAFCFEWQHGVNRMGAGWGRSWTDAPRVI